MIDTRKTNRFKKSCHLQLYISLCTFKVLKNRIVEKENYDLLLYFMLFKNIDDKYMFIKQERIEHIEYKKQTKTPP